MGYRPKIIEIIVVYHPLISNVPFGSASCLIFVSMVARVRKSYQSQMPSYKNMGIRQEALIIISMRCPWKSQPGIFDFRLLCA